MIHDKSGTELHALNLNEKTSDVYLQWYMRN